MSTAASDNSADRKNSGEFVRHEVKAAEDATESDNRNRVAIIITGCLPALETSADGNEPSRIVLPTTFYKESP